MPTPIGITTTTIAQTAAVKALSSAALGIGSATPMMKAKEIAFAGGHVTGAANTGRSKMTDIEVTLKPCPFCGEQPSGHGHGFVGYHYGIVDCECGAAVQVSGSEQDAIAAWNTRAATADLQAHADFQQRVGRWMLKCFTPEIAADVAELVKALNERDLFINPDLLDRAANEIDCGHPCAHIYEEGDVNYSMCVKSDRGDYCPNDVAETLRALAKVARKHGGTDEN